MLVAKIIHKGAIQYWELRRYQKNVGFDTKENWILLAQPIGSKTPKEIKWVCENEASIIWIKPFLRGNNEPRN